MSPRRRIIPIFVPHLGCPNQCVFCDQKRISGSLFPACGDTVREALDSLTGEGYELAFYGGSFTAIEAEQQEELLAAAQPYRVSGLVSSIRVSTRPDAIDREVLARLRRYGVETVELGAQSMTEEVLRRSGRGHSAEDTERAAALIKEEGFQLILQLMTGLPGESRQSALISAQRLAALGPDGVRLYPTVILRGTALEELWHRGEYAEHTVEEAVDCCADILPVFESAGIPVIRLGLNPTEELSGGAVAGGAYHPALGELVKSRIWLRRMRAALDGMEPMVDIIIHVPPSALSQAIGQKRGNVLALTEEYRLKSLKILPDAQISGENLHVSVAKRE